MTDMNSIERVHLLHGHTSEDTAYLVQDYPYGQQLRCKIRYWIETATRGAKKDQQRFVSQTTDARFGNTVWNKPHPSTYALMAVMYLDSQQHVQWTGFSGYSVTPETDAWWRYRGIIEQLTDQQRAMYDTLMKVSRRYAQPWQEWDAKVAAIAAHLESNQVPATVNDMWASPTGLIYLPSEHMPVYLAAARERRTT